MDIRDYMRIFRRQWLMIAGVFLAVVAVTAVFSLRVTPQYESTARMFVSAPQSDSANAYQGGQFSQQRVTSYADLLTGEKVAAQVVKSLGLKETPRDLSQHVTATVVPETVILTISVTDPDPARAQRLTQTYAEDFSTYVAELETPPGKDQPLMKATVVDSATLPTEPVSPQVLRDLGLAALLGLLVGLGLAVLRETLDNTIKSPEDLAGVTDAALLGAITYDKDAVKHPLITSLGSHAPRAEAFRVLRTNLQFVDVDRASKVIVLSSSVPGEGKTSTTTNLAISLSQIGQKVALLEGDLRRPRVSEYLRLESEVGVTTVLIGKLDLNDAIQPWGDGKLDILTSGAIPPNPSELLQSKAMASLFEELRSRYDIILVDAPPLLPVTDAALLSAQADGAVLVVRHGKTTRDQVRHSLENLEHVGARVVGTVLNMTPSKAMGSYGYGYGYGEAPKKISAEKPTTAQSADFGTTSEARSEESIEPATRR